MTTNPTESCGGMIEKAQFKIGNISNIRITQGKDPRRKPEKISDLNGIQTRDLCDAGAVLYQLSYQANCRGHDMTDMLIAHGGYEHDSHLVLFPGLPSLIPSASNPTPILLFGAK